MDKICNVRKEGEDVYWSGEPTKTISVAQGFTHKLALNVYTDGKSFAAEYSISYSKGGCGFKVANTKTKVYSRELYPSIEECVGFHAEKILDYLRKNLDNDADRRFLDKVSDELSEFNQLTIF